MQRCAKPFMLVQTFSVIAPALLYRLHTPQGGTEVHVGDPSLQLINFTY